MNYFVLTTIKMTGNLEDAYVAKETPMIYYLNIHTALEQLRTAAETSCTSGPRVHDFLSILYNEFSLANCSF